MGDKTEKDQKYTKDSAADMSRLFILKNVEIEYVDPIDVEVGEKEHDGPIGNPSPNTMLVHKTLTDRWVYIFQSLADKVTWYAEYRLDEKGLVHPVDMKAARDKERNKRPEPSKSDDGQGGKMMLPHTINGKRAYYAFFVIATRLPLESIKKLATPEGFKNLFKGGGIDLKDDKAYKQFDPRENKHLTPPPGTLIDYILVFDALKYGTSANKALQLLRDREVAWLVPAKNLNAGQRERTEVRQKKKLIASTMKALLDTDPKDKLEIRKKLKVGELNNWLSDYDSKTKIKKNQVNALVGHVQEFLMERFHMQFTVEANMLLEKVDPDGGDADLAQFFKEYSETINRFIETEQGLKYLTKIVDDKSHFLHNYVMNTGNAPRLYANAFGRMPGAFMWIFKEVFIPYRQKYGLAFKETKPLYGVIRIITDGEVHLEGVRYKNETGHIVTITRDAQINVITEERTMGGSGKVVVGDRTVNPLEATQQPGGQDIHATGGSVANEVKQTPASYITRLEVEGESITETHKPTNWSKNISEKHIANIKGALQAFQQITAVVNMGLAMFDLGDKGFNTWNLLNAAAAFGNTITAFGVLVRLTEASLQRIAFVTAIFDAVNSVHNALHAYDKGDKVGALGFAITALGSAMVAVGMGLAMIGIETSWTGVGLVIAIIGALIVVFGGSNDSELQQFAKHCIWGNSYGEDGGSDSWQEGRFENWHERKQGGLDRQIKAMMNLLQSFYVQGERLGVFVNLGVHDPKFKLQVKLEVKFHGERHETELVVEPDEKSKTGTKTRVVSFKNPDVFKTQSVSTSLVADRVYVRWAFKGYPYTDGRLDAPDYMTAKVRLDLKGDGSQMVPPSGNWVSYDTFSEGSHKPSRSLDE